jgi:hypothetical protein
MASDTLYKVRPVVINGVTKRWAVDHVIDAEMNYVTAICFCYTADDAQRLCDLLTSHDMARDAQRIYKLLDVDNITDATRRILDLLKDEQRPKRGKTR